MNQLDITFPKSEARADRLVEARRKPVLVRKPVMLQGEGGRIIGHVPRTQKECEEDFWARVKIGGMNECWEWIAGRHGPPPKWHYGVVWFNGKRWKAHQFAFMLTRGPIPQGHWVLHHCDNPPCCNPFHLFSGTPLDNIQDMISKGRAIRERGEDRYNATLTESDIAEIRQRFKRGDPVNGGSVLAREFGVGATMISAIIHRRRWKHVI